MRGKRYPFKDQDFLRINLIMYKEDTRRNYDQQN